MARHRDPLDACTGFEWDEGNAHKNWDLHYVTAEEAEDVFFNAPLVIHSDPSHSKTEKRYYALGQTTAGRRLFVAFTIRRSRIRVISVRDMNKRENIIYGQQEEKADS